VKYFCLFLKVIFEINKDMEVYADIMKVQEEAFG